MRRARAIFGAAILAVAGASGAFALRASDRGSVSPSGSAAIGAAASRSASDAVVRFMKSEIDGNYEASFALLSEEEQRDVGSAESWRARRVDRPRYLDFELMPDAPPDGAVDTLVRFEPRLDEVVGMIPARARVRWATEAVGNSHRVSLSRTRIDPVLPSERDVIPAALSWASDRQSCSGAPSYDGNLLGQPAIATSLCGMSGAFRSTGVSPLSASDIGPAVLSAFGGGAGKWTRVVHLEGPARIDVVAAPLGDRWVTVGVVAG